MVAIENSPPTRVSIDATLAKNLVIARVISGVTQQGLSETAAVSRATIAQIETGSSDPRLSTIADLASALGLPPILLLLGSDEVGAISSLLRSSTLPTLSSTQIARMRYLLSSGMLKDRLQCARLGAEYAKPFSSSLLASVASGIFSAFLPGAGTLAGLRLGQAILDQHVKIKLETIPT